MTGLKLHYTCPKCGKPVYEADYIGDDNKVYCQECYITSDTPSNDASKEHL